MTNLKKTYTKAYIPRERQGAQQFANYEVGGDRQVTTHKTKGNNDLDNKRLEHLKHAGTWGFGRLTKRVSVKI